MNSARRDFLRAAGLAVLVPLLPRRARAGTPYGGPFFLSIAAEGGWDPTLLCDPKGGEPIDRLYQPSEIVTAGGISVAPVGNASVGMTVPAFFEKHGKKILALNGVDTRTNNHEAGMRYVWTGQMGDGHPAFGALVAAALGPSRPMGFLSAGGYDATAGLVPLVRPGSIDALREVARPDWIDSKNPETQRFHTQATLDRIRDAHSERTKALEAKATLPGRRRALGTLMLARDEASDLDALALPESIVPAPKTPSGDTLWDLWMFLQSAQLAMAAFQSGLAVSASLSLGGFDTHGGHDGQHVDQLSKLLAGIDYVHDQAAAMGLGGKLVVVVGSDFGRTPFYNAQDGKDHWPITSLLLSGPGIAGGRVVGATDAGQKALAIDATTLKPAAGGVALRPEHVQRALRTLAGVENSSVSKAFPLAGEDLSLLS